MTRSGHATPRRDHVTQPGPRDQVRSHGAADRRESRPRRVRGDPGRRRTRRHAYPRPRHRPHGRPAAAAPSPSHRTLGRARPAADSVTWSDSVTWWSDVIDEFGSRRASTWSRDRLPQPPGRLAWVTRSELVICPPSRTWSRDLRSALVTLSWNWSRGSKRADPRWSKQAWSAYCDS